MVDTLRMTDRFTIRAVVVFLGLIVLFFGSAGCFLALEVLHQAAKAGQVEASAVAVMQIPFGICTTALGGLIGTLISTRSTPEKGEIDDALAPLMESGGIPVTGVDGGPVETIETGVDVGEAGEPEPDPPQPPPIRRSRVVKD